MQNQKDNNQNKKEAPKTEAEEHRDERIEKTGDRKSTRLNSSHAT